MTTKKYTVVSPVRINGRLFREGETVEVEKSLLAGCEHCVVEQKPVEQKPNGRKTSKAKNPEGE